MGKKRILLVDDDQDFAMALKVSFEVQGFDVLLAFDGLQGLKLARDEKPDLIILDVMLPGLDGYKVCRLLKYDRRYKDTPIIMVTVKSGREHRQLSETVGADCNITKPFDQDGLFGKVLQLLGGQREDADSHLLTERQCQWGDCSIEVSPGAEACIKRKDRRGHQRVGFGLRVFGKEGWLIRDLSPYGCFIRTSKPLAVDAKVDLLFQLPNSGQLVTIITRGIVRRSELEGMAIDFLNLAPSHFQFLQKFLNTC